MLYRLQTAINQNIATNIYPQSRYRIMAMATPRMARGYTLYAQPKPLEHTMLEYCLLGILRARRCIPACGWEIGGNAVLIKNDRQDENLFKDIFDGCCVFFH